MLVRRTDALGENRCLWGLLWESGVLSHSGTVHVFLGIRPEDQAKLFVAFTQVDPTAQRRQEGPGLGLHLSQKLAEVLGGRIECRSKYGVGSTFTLRIVER